MYQGTSDASGSNISMCGDDLKIFGLAQKLRSFICQERRLIVQVEVYDASIEGHQEAGLHVVSHDPANSEV